VNRRFFILFCTFDFRIPTDRINWTTSSFLIGTDLGKKLDS